MGNKKNKVEQPLQQNKKGLFVSISLLAILVSVIYSYKLKWAGDDIFIALRYVQNFIAGNGLVYNIGERVEGYTDFLWLMLISVFSKLNFNPLTVTQVLGILSSLGTLVVCSIIGYKISKKYNAFILPYITIALALNYDYNVWATSGLETSFYGFLLCASFYVFFFSEFNENKKLFLSGLFLVLAIMTRPDALLIAFGVNGLLMLNQLLNKTKLSKIILMLLFLNLAFLVIYFPYFLWRYNYYGFLFPNTYYVKLGNETLFSKGFFYIWLYFKPHFTSLLIIILPPVILLPILKGKSLERLKEYTSDKWNAAFLTCVIVVYAYLILFVAKVGGDFMHARFIIPLAPFMYFIICYSVLKLVSNKNLNIIFTLLLLCSFIETKIRFNVFKAPDKNGKIITTLNGDVADERWVYTTYFPIENEIKLGKDLHRVFEGIDAKLLVRGGQACMGYYANFKYEQEFHGLTDTLIAHSKIQSRGRIGHEKHGTNEYFQNKGINFLFNRSPLTKDTFRYALIKTPAHSFNAEIITYNIRLITQLKERHGDHFQFTDFQLYLDNYIKTKLQLVSYEKLKADYDNFYLYYFKHNDDRTRENIFINALTKSKKT